MQRNSSMVQVAYLSLASVSSAVALVGLWVLFDAYDDQARNINRVETRSVMVAATDLYQGVAITAADVEEIEVPVTELQDGTFTERHFLIGRIPHERILKQEMIRSERLSSPRTGKGMNGYIASGWRGISIAAQKGAALEGHLYPSNHVDILAYYEREDGTRTSETVLENVLVLAVNDEAEDVVRSGSGRASMSNQTVTLMVQPDDAESLALHDYVGDLRLILRPPGESKHYFGPDGVTIEQIFGTPIRPQRKNRTPKAEPQDCTSVKVINGKQARSTACK